ncbi:MAG: MBL fold metallo-hydrolase [Fibrella sp.]|nr:MBL fold metallo-hydrolase [Armatimonadota bacterium]
MVPYRLHEIESPIPDFHQNLRVVLLGTGSPRAYLNRAKSAALILAGYDAFLLDCGGAVVDQLLRAGMYPHRINDVFFTHHHSDHNSGFFDFFISSWRSHVGIIKGRSEPLRVYGPTNTRAIIGRMREGFDYDVSLRIGYNKSDAAAAEIVYTELDNGIIYEKNGVKVTVFEVDHRPVHPALGYVFEYNGRKVVLSGDTRPVPAMADHAQNADLLIHDALQKNWLDAIAEANPEDAVQVRNPQKYHTTTLEAAQIARDANVKKLALTHLIPPPAPDAESEAAFVEGMDAIYPGPIVVARDLMSFDV